MGFKTCSFFYFTKFADQKNIIYAATLYFKISERPEKE